MKLLTRRGLPVKEQGSSYLADGDAESDDARVLRPLHAAARTYRIAFGPRVRDAAPVCRCTAIRKLVRAQPRRWRSSASARSSTGRSTILPSTATAAPPADTIASTTRCAQSSSAALGERLRLPTSTCRG